jgi:hypothetical protein
MSKNKKNNAVSELLATFLLLLIVVSVMAIIYINFQSDNGPTPVTHIYIVGSIMKENVSLIHQGGESLGINDQIKFRIGETIYNHTIVDLLIDKNNNNKWDFGEEIEFPFEIDLSRIDEYEYIDVTAIDSISNSIVFQGPVFTKYRSDIGLKVYVDNYYPSVGDQITITINAWCYGGDVAGAGDVSVNCSLPESLIIINYLVEQGNYDEDSGIWHIGNLLVEDSPVTLTITAKISSSFFIEPTQFVIIFEGSDYTSGSVSVWQNTYLSGLRFAMYNDTIFPHDGSVEFTVITCGYDDPPRAEVELPPTIITADNYNNIAQDLRNTPYPSGFAPISSAIRLAADQLKINYDSYDRQIILIVSSGNPDCIWNGNLGGGYGANYTPFDIQEVQDDTIFSAFDYLNDTINFNITEDELNAVTVAKTVDLRNSTFLNESIVRPIPGNIYNITNPIQIPGWVFEVEPGKDEFQEAITLIIELLLNSIRIEASLDGSTTVDPNGGNNIGVIIIEPTFI